MNIARQLDELQQLDQEIESTEQAISRLIAELGESEALKAARSSLEAAQREFADRTKQQRELEWEADDLSSKIKVIDEKLYSGRVRSPKELTDLLHEVEGLKANRSQVEDRALAALEQTEQASARVDMLSGALKRVEAEWSARQSEVSVELERLRASLTVLRERRQQAAARTEHRAVSFYDQLRQTRRPAVARVEQGICRGCRIALSTAELQRVRTGEMVTCSTCGRILYLA